MTRSDRAGRQARFAQLQSSGSGDLPSFNAAYEAARRHDTGGAAFTRFISGRLGSWVAASAIRLGVHPSIVTLASLLLGTCTSAVVIAFADRAQAWWWPGWVAFVGWQLAYVLDCADGQVARATGKKSDHGARLDVLVDYAVHCSVIVALLTVVAAAGPLPVAVLVLPATLWFVGTFTGVLRRSATDDQSLIRGRKIVAEVIKMAGDNGATMFVLGGWLLVHPRTVFVPVAAFTLANLVLLVGSIWRNGRRSMYAGRRHDSPGDNPVSNLVSRRTDGV